MSGSVLRLAGPMQSWGEHSEFGDRDTLPYPSRSGLIGMFAAAQGVTRDESLERYENLRLTLRIDSPGLHMSDFHTIGGGLPRARTVPTAEGKRRPENATTIVTRRSYLADAVFTVAVTGPGADDIGRSLLSPRWQSYLGRRSFVPDPLLVLRTEVPDPVQELRTGVPLPWRRLPAGAQSADVDLVTEDRADVASRTVLNDVPLSFTSRARRYASREVRVDSVEIPARLVAPSRRDYQDLLFSYVKEHR
ncbi:type I-E CRISPR-associated protein Cas5/CasD [Nocardiopsis listeri]|uniref:type I-E CRISPR-associated protein Cas5/CasD n=1 Tax=Nocardiopsis listeri TaxID=53440 RepID=UPI000831FACB|nr:type I-E CRISPR-associated protein Cas5/CasD [Nocardiopsis listeri]